MEVDGFTDLLAGILLMAGTTIAALGALGVLRMPDPYMRAQAGAKPGTLGLILIFLAVALHFGDLAIVAASAGIVGLALLSIPVGSHMIARATHVCGIPIGDADAIDELRNRPTRGDGSNEARRAPG